MEQESSPARSAGGLHALLSEKRQELIERWSQRIKTAIASDPLTHAELLDSIPLFVDELIAALYPEAAPLPGPSVNAREHGSQRLRIRFNIGEVVREYGMLHSTILELARESGQEINHRDHAVIAKWLSDGLVHAVSRYQDERDVEQNRIAAEHLAFIAHELRNPLAAAHLSFQQLKRRDLAQGGRMVDSLERNLRRATEVIDNALVHASFSMGVAAVPEAVSLAALLAEIELDTSAEAHEKGVEVATQVEPGLVIPADPRLLRSALSNLVRNALKFTAPDSTIVVRAERDEHIVTIEIIDACGGLPPGRAEELFAPLVQKGTDRSGFGLGLAIALHAAKAHGGTIRVRNLPGRGCVFGLELPWSGSGP